VLESKPTVGLNGTHSKKVNFGYSLDHQKIAVYTQKL